MNSFILQIKVDRNFFPKFFQFFCLRLGDWNFFLFFTLNHSILMYLSLRIPNLLFILTYCFGIFHKLPEYPKILWFLRFFLEFTETSESISSIFALKTLKQSVFIYFKLQNPNLSPILIDHSGIFQKLSKYLNNFWFFGNFWNLQKKMDVIRKIWSIFSPHSPSACQNIWK